MGALAGLVGLAAVAAPVRADVKITKVRYFGQPNCYRISNGAVEIIVTTDIGPRVIRYGFVGGENILAELPDTTVKTAWGTWHAWGGSRLWSAPEGLPRSYSPDNTPIAYNIIGNNTIQLTQPTEPKTGIQKQITVTLDAVGSHARVRYRLINRNPWAIETAPWALTIMNGGGTTIIPQEPYLSHDAYLQPARPIVLWHYTNLADPRFAIGPKYIRLTSEASRSQPQKVGIGNKQGWVAYNRKNVLFLKRFPYKSGANYPDYGCNCETYTAGSFMEVETLGPLARLEPGWATDHTENWSLFHDVNIGTTEASVATALKPLLTQPRPAPSNSPVHAAMGGQ